jgi:hypothetical protein
MPKIILEKYENGVLVERQTEGSNFKPWKWAMTVIHLLIAISLAVLAVVALSDSMALRSALSQDEATPTSCDQPGFRS